MSTQKVRITDGINEAEIVLSSLTVWRRKGWHLVGDAPQTTPDLRDDSAATLDSGGPATATMEE